MAANSECGGQPMMQEQVCLNSFTPQRKETCLRTSSGVGVVAKGETGKPVAG